MASFHAMKGNNGLNTTIPHSHTAESNDTHPTAVSSSSSPRSSDSSSIAAPPPPPPSSSSSVVGVVTQNAHTIPDQRLKQAAEKFVDFSKRLHELHQAVNGHYQDLLQTAQSRQRVLTALARMAHNSPLQEIMSSASSEATACYQNAADAAQTTALLETYRTELVDYVREWETTVAARVGTELKHVATLYNATEKYRAKVQQLQHKQQSADKNPRRAGGLLRWNSNSKIMKSNHTSSSSTVSHNNHNNHNQNTSSDTIGDKLVWNESKLRNAKRDYRRNLLAATLFTEEVTDRAWKELVPFLLRHMDLDGKAAASWYQMATIVAQLRNEMVALSQSHEMDFESLHKGRLRILREEDAMDFVPHTEWNDLESTVVPSEQPAELEQPPPTDAALLSPATTTTRQQSQQERQDSPQGHAAVEVTLQNIYGHRSSPNNRSSPSRRNHQRNEEEKKFDLEEESLVSGSGLLKYPRYIDVNANETSKLDDETTLTGLPDMVSV